MQLKTNDDVRQLQSLPLNLQQAEKEIKKLTGSDIGSKFYIIQANNTQKMLEKQHKLTNIINKKYPKISNPYLSFSDYIPTINEQKQNYLLVTNQLHT